MNWVIVIQLARYLGKGGGWWMSLSFREVNIVRKISPALGRGRFSARQMKARIP